MRIRRRINNGRQALMRKGMDAGMTTAEYSVGTLAACAFAAVLLVIVKSDGVKSLVTDVITTALSVGL
ncbi:MAG: DUF4244 domain-containing protein [Ornithinimicrobium sp.]|jgi:sorbitol-specific phosphotransferase system component IIC|uniref:DUF4244 domain-containing protein n=1 Tax=Ornithinimicrobium sp. TaxID=1977084 RepID=UPI003D9B051E